MALAPWGNVAIYAAAALAPSALCWLLLSLPRLLARLPHPRRPTEVPRGVPIEQLAADLRRVRRLLSDVPPGTPRARRIGVRQAYDGLLVQACVALEVEHRLDVLPEGIEREVERLRVEESLRSAGLAIP